jgi:hypothetical protein
MSGRDKIASRPAVEKLRLIGLFTLAITPAWQIQIGLD